jgi:predicted membrane protein
MSTSIRPSHTASPGDTPPPPPPEDRAPEEPPAARPHPVTRPIGWALALIGAGILWLLTLAGIQIDWELVLPITIITVGLALLVGGRRVARSGLIGLGIVLTAIALIVSVTPMQVSLSAGDRSHTVTDIAELESSYRLGAGTLTLDLRDLELPAGTTELDASVSMGELVVRVPDDVAVTGTGNTLAGEVVAFGRTTAGLAPRRTLDELGVDDGPVLDLQLRTGLGRIEVTR